MKDSIVTGGFNGLLGPVITDTLIDLGYKVCYFDLPEYDLAKSSDINKFYQSMTEIPNVIVHNAGIDPKPGSDNGKDPFRIHEGIMRVNHIGAVYMNKLFIPKMIENGGGIIIIIGSIMGYISANQDNYKDGWTKAFGYNESKAALISHCHNLNTTFGKYGIRAVMPSFGPFERGLSPDFMKGFGQKIPLRKPVSEEDIQLTIKYCLECESLAGEFRVDGGYTRVGK